MRENLPIRKIIRLKDYDYSEEGAYFITICTKNRECILSEIETCRGEHCSSVLTQTGKIVDKYVKKIEEIYDNIIIDEYIIMPNHIHILLLMNYKNGVTISKIVKHYKANISREIECPIWQKSFYEHIVRNEKEYLKIKEYIKNNVINWKKDKYF